MNLDKLFAWIVGVVIAFASTGQLDVLQAWVWRAQARVTYESRSSNWGSPRFFRKKRALKSTVPKQVSTLMTRTPQINHTLLNALQFRLVSKFKKRFRCSRQLT